MNFKSFILLSALVLSSIAQADVVPGYPCSPDVYCPPGGPVTPGNPGRPNPGRPPERPPQRPDHPRPPDYPNRPDYPNYPDYPHRPDPSPYDPPYYPPNPYPQPNPPHYPPQDPYPPYGNDRQVYVGRYLRDQSLDLISLANLNYNDRGAVIESVEARVRDGDGYNTVALVANGYTVASDSYLSSLVILRPYSTLIVGDNLYSLNFQVRGKLFVDSITVRLRRGYPNPPPTPGNIVLEQGIYQTVYGGSIEIGSRLGLGNYPGYRVQSVTINGQSQEFGGANAQVLINSFSEGSVYLQSFASDQTVYPRSSQLRGGDSLFLYLDRAATINRVRVVLQRY